MCSALAKMGRIQTQDMKECFKRRQEQGKTKAQTTSQEQKQFSSEVSKLIGGFLKLPSLAFNVSSMTYYYRIEKN